MMDIPEEMTVSLQVDADGMIDRECPNTECGRYFKVSADDIIKSSEPSIFCPYCKQEGDKNDFITKDQEAYMMSIVTKTITEAIVDHLEPSTGKRDLGMGMSLSITLETEIPEIKDYAEKKLKRVIKCQECNNSFAVIGPSYFCPFHGNRQPLAVYRENVDSIRAYLTLEQIVGADAWEKIIESLGPLQFIEKTLENAVTAYETYCKTKYGIKKAAVTPNTTKEDHIAIVKNAFQNLDRGDEIFSTEFGFSCLTTLTPTEIAHCKKCFQKRHLLTHNSGIIDQKYITETNESKSLLGKRVTVNGNEVDRLLTCLEKPVGIIETNLS